MDGRRRAPGVVRDAERARKGTPTGVTVHGVQIWINVPSDMKIQDPLYGVSSVPDQGLAGNDDCSCQAAMEARVLHGGTSIWSGRNICESIASTLNHWYIELQSQ